MEGSFLAISNYSWSQADGIFKVEYLVTVDPDTLYTNETQRVLFICNLENCLHSLKAKIVTECDSKTLSKLKDKIDQIELIIYGIKSAFSCGDFTTANKLIARCNTYLVVLLWKLGQIRHCLITCFPETSG